MKRSMMQNAIGFGGGLAILALAVGSAGAMPLAQAVPAAAKPAMTSTLLRSGDPGGAQFEVVKTSRKHKAKRTSRRGGEGSRGHEAGETPAMERLETPKKL